MNISELLSERNLTPEMLMPIHRPANEVVFLNVPGKDAAPFPPFLPLHYFDDETFEVWTPEEWLKKGVDRKVYKPVPAKALLPSVPSNQYSKPLFKFSQLTRMKEFQFGLDLKVIQKIRR